MCGYATCCTPFVVLEADQCALSSASPATGQILCYELRVLTSRRLRPSSFAFQTGVGRGMGEVFAVVKFGSLLL